jgi:hypothetical protein
MFLGGGGGGATVLTKYILVFQVKELRRKQQMKHQAEYDQMLISEKQLIETWRGGHMKEEIGDEVTTPYKVPYKCHTVNCFLNVFSSP